jgi:hypothetical protein
MTLTQNEGLGLTAKTREVGMKIASDYRALASLYRQQAAYNPSRSWHLLGQAERWEHLAEQELASPFQECNSTSPNDFERSSAMSAAKWKTIVAA